MINNPPLFPGIDPFVEAQRFWPDFHGSFMGYYEPHGLPLNEDSKPFVAKLIRSKNHP